MSVEIIDLSNYRDRTGSRVPEGQYLVQVEDIEVGNSQKGDPMWTVYYRIVGGEHDGMTLIDRLTHTEKAMFRVVGFLQGMGVKVQRKKMRVDTSRLVGRKMLVQVADGQPYNGTVRSEVRSYERFSAPKSQEQDLEDIDNGVESESDEQDAPPTSSKAKAKPEPVEEEIDEVESETTDDAEIDLDDIDL